MDSRDEREGRIREPLHDERGSTVARVIAVAALVAAIALAALAMFGGGSSYTVHAVFDNAGQLVPGNQVRVGGQPIGSITDITLDNDANAVVTMKIEDDLAPLHDGSTATIRATSLSGIANRYISLKPGPNNAQKIDDGGRIGTDDTSAPVDLDVLFNTLDPKTREGLRNFIRGSGDWYDGKAQQARQSTKYFAPWLSSSSDLTSELSLDQAVFTRFIKDGAATLTAIASRRDDLSALVSNTNQTMAAIGDESTALQQALTLLPGTLRKANTTFVNLRSTLDDLQRLVDESKPATKQLAPFFQKLRPLIREARPTVKDLSELISKPGPGQRPDRVDRRPAAAGQADGDDLPARDPRARPLPAGDRVRAPVHARHRRLDHQVRRGRGLLRRQRSLRARAAGLRPDRPVGRRPPGGTPGAPLRGLRARHPAPLPGRLHPAAA